MYYTATRIKNVFLVNIKDFNFTWKFCVEYKSPNESNLFKDFP